MRKVIEKQLKYWQVDISSIQIDLRSRDEIHQFLLGLRAIYNDRRICEEVFTIVKKNRIVAWQWPTNINSLKLCNIVFQ